MMIESILTEVFVLLIPCFNSSPQIVAQLDHCSLFLDALADQGCFLFSFISIIRQDSSAPDLDYFFQFCVVNAEDKAFFLWLPHRNL